MSGPGARTPAATTLPDDAAPSGRGTSVAATGGQGSSGVATADPSTIELPAPTAWPLVVAFGVSFGFAGLVTSPIVSLVGVVAFLTGVAGWFREVLPREHLVAVPLRPPAERARPVTAVPHRVEHLTAGAERHRMRVPIEIHPYSSGLRGGMIGAIVMALLAGFFGLISHDSVWYPINLLAAAALPSMATAAPRELLRFDATALVAASLIHLSASALVGLLYGMILPMIPRHPALVGGFLAPLLWSGLLWATLGVIDPTLAKRIDWLWFIASQIGFGLAAGNVVARTEKIATLQSLPFATRAGIEAQEESAGEDSGR